MFNEQNGNRNEKEPESKMLQRASGQSGPIICIQRPITVNKIYVKRCQ